MLFRSEVVKTGFFGSANEVEKREVVAREVPVCQFSWTCDPLHNKTTNIQSRWSESVKVAQVAVASKQSMADITEGATHFHAAYVKPVWAKTLRRVAQIDDHLFYKR